MDLIGGNLTCRLVDLDAAAIFIPFCESDGLSSGRVCSMFVEVGTKGFVDSYCSSLRFEISTPRFAAAAITDALPGMLDSAVPSLPSATEGPVPIQVPGL